MSTKVKICGLSRMEDIACVNEYLPDYAGFVFAKSRRQVTPGQAARLKEALDPRILAVGVFVNAQIEEICRLCSQGILDLVQLHGDEDGEYLERLSASIQAPVIRAVRVQSAGQVLKAQEQACDYLLLDTFLPGQYGGGGHTFDLSLIPPLTKPWFLAGGLDAGNVAERVAQCQPFGVDVSSGVETQGKKDPEKIRKFIESLHAPL